LTTEGNTALPAAITNRAMSSAGRFQRRRSRKAIESGASNANDPASVTIPAMLVRVASRWPAIACNVWRSKPGAQTLTPIPSSAVSTARPVRIASTRRAKAM